MSRASEREGTGKTRNRNAERSIRLLQTAFVQLLAEKPYEKITVTDVTSAADLNRGTFYAHFENMDALRDAVFDGLASTLSQLLDKVIEGSFVLNPTPVLSELGRYLHDNRELLQKLMTSKTLEPFLNSLRATLRAHIHAYLSSEVPEDAPTNLLVADYLSYGVLGVYRAWIMGEYGSRTVEEVNASLCSLVQGARGTLGV